MPERTFDLLVAGELNPDAILAGEKIEPEYGQVERLVERGALTVGSSGAIVACGAARLGMRVAYVGVVGDDAGGRFMLDELRARGIDTERCRVDAERATGLSIVLSTGSDRAILTSVGAMSSLTGADVSDEALAASAHLHVSSPQLQPGLRDGLAELFDRAHAAGASTSLDPGWDPADRWGAELARAAAPAVQAADATGAGDSLAAGFLSGLHTGMSLGEALRLGVACGSLSTRALGGVESQPALAEALALARTQPAEEAVG